MSASGARSEVAIHAIADMEDKLTRPYPQCRDGLERDTRAVAALRASATYL
jgi:hypothetical protein